jgi:hypothetical protein
LFSYFPLLAGFDGVAGLAKYLVAVSLNEHPFDVFVPRDKAANGVHDRHDVIDLGFLVWDKGGAGGTEIGVAGGAGAAFGGVLWTPAI